MSETIIESAKPSAENIQPQKVEKKPPQPQTKIHKNTKCIKLEEDGFGFFVDDFGKKHDIKRFTWTNHNCMRAQVITYGARITSLQLPNRKRQIDDVVLGFDNMQGYLCNDDLKLGATLGRVTGKVEKATFAINNIQHWLSANDGCDHSDGGFKGLDKVVWTPDVQDSKVMLSYIAKDLDEGYPGDLFVRITFELAATNEFIIDMEAFTTRPTIINLTNLLYFNLGGHSSGADELYKHIVTINSNCFIPLMDNGLPSGEILNVVYTKNDLQIPKLMNDVLGLAPDDGYDEHFCVNRGIGQGICFAARALHPPSGRILEMYSNQWGMHFSTANHFGYGVADMPSCMSVSSENKSKGEDDVFQLIERLHGHVGDILYVDYKKNYQDLKDLIHKLHRVRFGVAEKEGLVESKSSTSQANNLEMENIVLTPNQAKYLENMITATRRDTPTNYADLEEVIKTILETVAVKDEIEMSSIGEHSSEIIKTEAELHKEELEKEIAETKSKEDSILERKGLIRFEKKIECCCKGDRIHGKGNAIYKRHGAICFQSGNYPNAIYHKNFPNCELHPGETYKHTIIYKFWIQSGNPNLWLKRNFSPSHK